MTEAQTEAQPDFSRAASLLPWLFEAAVTIEVLPDKATPPGQPERWSVWVSNGEVNPFDWVGACLAECHDELSARLVATGLEALTNGKKGSGEGP